MDEGTAEAGGSFSTTLNSSIAKLGLNSSWLDCAQLLKSGIFGFLPVSEML
jgi:hypothetical protein